MPDCDSQDEFLFNPVQIDLLSMAADGVAELTLVQANPWTGSPEQVQSFCDKVEAYVSYALDGQMVARYPQTKGCPWRIAVRSYSGTPDPITGEAIRVLAARLPGYGGSITVHVGSLSS